MFSVTGFQNALLSSEMMSSACSSVTLFNSVVIRRAGKSGSNITVNSAIFATVSNTIFASLDIFSVMGARESGLISGGMDASGCSLGSGGTSAAASASRFLSEIIAAVRRSSCSAMGLEGSITPCALEFRQRPLQVALPAHFEALLDVQFAKLQSESGLL